jgi:CHAT domain-containing protein
LLRQNRLAQLVIIFLLGLSITMARGASAAWASTIGALRAAQVADAPRTAPVLSASSQQLRPLELNKPIEGELRRGEKQSFLLLLKPLDYARVAISARGLDHSITLTAPDGKIVAEYRWLSGSPDPAVVSVIGEYSGNYKIELASQEKEDLARNFSIKLTEVRMIESLDAERIEAERAFARGEQFRSREANPDRRPALDQYQQALKSWRALGDRNGEANALQALGSVHDNLSERDKAMEYYSLALPIRRELKDRRGEAATLNGMAGANNAQGNLRKALELYQQVLAIRQELNDRRGVAQTFHSLGQVYRGVNNLKDAAANFTQALEIRQELKEQRGAAQSLIELGAIERNLGRTKQALENYTQALAVFREFNDRGNEAVTLNSVGVVHLSQFQPREALPYFEQAYKAQEELGQRRAAAVTLNNMGAAYDQLGESAKALEHFNRALQVRREINDQTGIVNTLNFIGQYHAERGEYNRALEFYTQARTLARQAGNPGREAEVLVTTANLYNDRGDRQAALDSLLQALAFFKGANIPESQASALSSIGAVYKALDERQLALDHFTQALAIRQTMANPSLKASELINIGVTYQAMGEHQKALDYFNQALELAKNNKAQTARTLNEASQVYNDLDDQQKALEFLNRALPLARETRNRLVEARTLHNLGWTYRALKEVSQSRDYLKQSLTIYADLGYRSGEASTHFALARVEYDAGNFGEARTHIETALDIAEQLRSNVTSQDLRASYFASVQKYYDLYIEILMKQNEQQGGNGLDAEALKASEAARARSLLDLLSEAGADFRQDADVKLLERERDLLQQINARANQQVNLRLGRSTPEQMAALTKELQTLTAEYKQVQSQIRSSRPRYAALTQPQPLDLREIQSLLDADTMLLEYFLGDDHSYLWAVTPTTMRSYKLPKRSEINDAARQVYELLIARNVSEGNETERRENRRIAQADAQFAAAASKLSRMVLAPVARQLGKKRLVIVAQGALQYVPFGALPLPWMGRLGDGGTGRKNGRPIAPSPHRPVPLIADHEIINLPSASTLAVLRRDVEGRKPAAKTLAIFADPVFDLDDERIAKITIKAGAPTEKPKKVQSSSEQTRRLKHINEQFGSGRIPRLPFTRQEAEQILSLVPDTERKAALDFAASRASVTGDDLKQYRIIHFATHGLVNSQQPELSSIVLSLVDEKGESQEGFLRLHEIYGLNLPAEVVVLSACETGLGKEIKGEGLVGLTRGFMYAGAPRVVVSLWAVNDRATSELMAKFYQKMLKENLRPAAALRAAQVEMSKDRRWNNPYYWAAFALQGEWR